MDISDGFVQIGVIVLTALFYILGNQIKTAYQNKVDNEREKSEVEKRKLQAESAKAKNDMLNDAVRQAVYAAEQLFSNMEKSGEKKFRDARGRIAEYCNLFDIRLTETQVTTLIEAAVSGLNAGLKAREGSECQKF